MLAPRSVLVREVQDEAVPGTLAARQEAPKVRLERAGQCIGVGGVLDLLAQQDDPALLDGHGGSLFRLRVRDIGEQRPQGRWDLARVVPAYQPGNTVCALLHQDGPRAC